MIDSDFGDLTPEDVGLTHVTAEVAEARSRLAARVCDELRRAGLPACLRTIGDQSPGAKVDVDPFEESPGVDVYWNCDPSVHAEFDTGCPDGGPAFQYFIQAAGQCRPP
ncbi:hypothetical protein AB0M57_06910 [Streptomyces sp. NPDC051597]|uniref:hypothetical protein n=1 Tax=Streptomyces sp. NPDC051597 TaxID=3155049 RepID=UPI003418724C